MERDRTDGERRARVVPIAASRPAAAGADVVGFLHSWEAGTMVDGPGIRLVVFLAGCLLRCQYCHNPDTWHEHNGRPFTVGEAMALVGRYRKVLALGGGGITLSGGEPTLQHRFVAALMRACKAEGVHTCLDTSGRMGEALSDDELAQIDLTLLDIKSGDPAVYEQVTRQPMQPTLDFAHRLAALGRPAWIRFVVVPGLTDGADNVERLADIVAGLPNVERVELLPFHQMGRDKWERLGLDYTLASTEPPTAERMERVREPFRRRGITVY